MFKINIPKIDMGRIFCKLQAFVQKNSQWIYATVAFMLAVLLSKWKSPAINENSKRDTFLLAAHNDKSEKIKLKTEKNVEFNIKWIGKSPKYYFCPYFPCIYVETTAPVSQWIQVGYSDNKYGAKNFIDCPKEAFYYPFYVCYGSQFFDAPGTIYSLFSKPRSYMRFNAFAVECNANEKTIRCLGGIEWGYRLSYFWLRPIAIRPRLLKDNAWKKAWDGMIKESLPGYRVIE